MLSAEVVGWLVVFAWSAVAGAAGAYLASRIRRRSHKGPRL
jgi:hypothetical protein